MKRLVRRIAALLCAVSCATLTAVEIRAFAITVRTGDRNGDGRPDVWRYFDARGQITEVDVDSNFDGRPDIEEYYEQGVLVRRESDRNFNGQADLIEEFDVATHRQTRSVIDVDFDGTADLVVLFRDGRPVFTKRADRERSGAPPHPAAAESDSVHLIPLTDPFQAETALRTSSAGWKDEEGVGLSTCGGLPAPRFVIVRLLAAPARVPSADVFVVTPTLLLPRSPRAPPAI